VKLLDLSKGAYQYYIHNTRDNLHTSFLRAREKLTRNVRSGVSCGFDGLGREIVWYGYLRIAIKDGVITWIENCKDEEQPHDIDLKMYEKLNRKLGIN
jgi:hypothetical protein